MNENLCKLAKYWVDNRLRINSYKTKYVIFDRPRGKNLNSEIDLQMNGVKIDGVPFYNYLGVKLDKILSYKSPIVKLVSSCNLSVFTLCKVWRFVPEPIALLIYKSLIMAKLSYGGIACIGARKPELEKLQKIQNRALRICYCASRYTSNILLHKHANILPLFLRRKYVLYNMMCKRLAVKPGAATSTSKPVTRYSLASPATFVMPSS